MAVKDRLATVPVIGTALAVQERYKQDAADQLAAAIGFFGFLSLFPLMILAVAAAGFVYGDPAEQERVATLITQSIPGFEATMGGDDDTAVSDLVANVVDNRAGIGLVGLGTLLLTGLRVINSAMTASTVVFRAAVPTGVKAKLHQLVVMVVLGLLALAAVAASSLAGVTGDILPRWAALVVALGLSLLFDFLLFLASYRLLRGDALVTARQLVPGAVLAAVGWTALKVAGASYVGGQVDDANALYGALGGVIALLLLLYLAGRLYLYGAQLSAVLLERRAGPLEEFEEAGDTDDEADTAASGTDARAPGSDAPPPGDAHPPGHVPVPAAGTAGGDPGPAATRVRPQIASPAVGQTTRERLAVAPARRAQAGDARGAAGFALGAAALVAAWRFLRED